MSAGDNLLPSGYLQTFAGSIVDSTSTVVRLAGVNWYGFDCSSMVAGGLDFQTVDAVCGMIVDLGFNTIRLPYCLQMVQENPVITTYLKANPSLQGKTALEIMDAIIDAAGAHGLKVILDSHRSEAGWSTQGNGLWYTDEYPEATWLECWSTMVQRYKDLPSASNPTVIGCDLRNEPGDPPPWHPRNQPAPWPGIGGALWGYDGGSSTYPRDWAAAAERAGNAILADNPQLLIFVEGVKYDPAGPSQNNGVYWPGGNLTGVGNAHPPERPAPVPVRLDVPNRLVYSVHDYGPRVSPLAWAGPSSTQADCNQVWDHTWGYIVKQGIAPVWLGEFGTENGYRPGDSTPAQYFTDPNSVTPQGAWFTHLVTYLADLQDSYGGGNWCYWSINGSNSEAPGRDPTQPDFYGVLKPDWSGVASQPLLNKLQSIQ